MSTYALIIGIESYPRCKTGLTGNVLPGAVHDVLLFQDWIKQTHQPQKIWLHLSPQGKAPEALDPQAQPATREAIKSSLFELRNMEQVDHLFFYFSGHGFQFGSDLASRAEDVLVCADFKSVEESGDLTIRFAELLTVLAGLGPGEQFYFIDACRNSISQSELSVGRLGINLLPSPLGVPSQFAIFATMPGRTAAAGSLQEGPPQASPFVSALLDGLRGSGQAKRWDSSSEEERLIVDFASLYRFIKPRMRSEGQLPTQNVWGDSPGELAVLYPPGPEPLLECKVQVSGGEADSHFSATALIGRVAQGQTELVHGAGSLMLRAAQSYTVKVSGEPQYQIIPEQNQVALFDAQKVEFRARPRGVSFGIPRSADPIDSEVLFTLPQGNHLTKLNIFGGEASSRERGSGPSRVRAISLREPSAHNDEPPSLGPVVLASLPKHVPHGWKVKLPLGTYVSTVEEVGKELTAHPFRVRGSGSADKPEQVSLVDAMADVRLETPLQRGLRSKLGKSSSDLSQQLLTAVDCSVTMWLAVLGAELAWPEAQTQPLLAPLLPEAVGRAGLLLLIVSDEQPTLTWRRVPDSKTDKLAAEQGVLQVRSEALLPNLYCAWGAPGPGSFEVLVTLPGESYRLPVTAAPSRLTSLVLAASTTLPPSYGVYLLPAQSERSGLHADELAGFEPLIAARLLESSALAFEQRQPLPASQPGQGVPLVDPLLLTMAAYFQFSKGQRKQAIETLQTLDRRFPWMPDRAALRRLAEPASPPAEGPPGVPLFRHGFLALQGQSKEPAVSESAQLDKLVWTGAFTRFRA